MGRVGRDVDRLAGSHNRFGSAERNFDLAFENGEHLFEIVAMRRRTASRRNVHINEAVAAGGVFAGENNRVRVPRETDVRQRLISVWSRDRELSREVIGRDSRTASRHTVLLTLSSQPSTINHQLPLRHSLATP